MTTGIQRWWTQRRWWVALMLCAVTTISYVDRLVLSTVAPTLRAQFNFTHSQYGLITLAFLLAYAAGQLLLGPLIDRLGSKRALTLAVFWWSIASVGHALARGVAGFVTARGLLGFAEAASFPGAHKVISEWFPRAERSLASGLIAAGTGLGAIVAPPLTALLVTVFDRLHDAGYSPVHGWQGAFIVPGLLGFVWIAVWKRRFWLPESDTGLSEQERALILAGRTGEALAPARTGSWRGEIAAYFGQLRHWFGYREAWGLAVARFLGDSAFYFFAFWIPSYLVEVRHLSLLQIAWAAALPFVFADLGSLFGGWTGQRLIRGGMSVDRSRKTMIWAGALLVPVGIFAIYVQSPVLAVLCMGAGIFAIQLKSASMFAVPGDIFPPRAVGTVWGATGAAGSAAAAFSQPLIGWTIDHYSYEPAFIVVCLLNIGSAAAISLLIRRIAPVGAPPAATVP